MIGAQRAQPRPLAEVSRQEFSRALSRKGVWLDLGAAVVRAQSDSGSFAAQLQAVYRQFPFVEHADWADVHVRMQRPASLRRWLRPRVVLRCDGKEPFEPFPASSPLPLFEWGCNSFISRRLNDLLLLHAGVVARDGVGLILPALPGSGKSTLCAALSLKGWRLLSDEFGAFDPSTGALRAVLKPIALKNQSIQVIRRFAPEAVFGTEFQKTRKGSVAHLGASAKDVDQRHQVARPGAIVLPKWSAGAATRFEPLPENVVFPALAFNAFNYGTLGAVGFRGALQLVRQCAAWRLVYSDLDEALATLEVVWPNVVARQQALAQ